MIVVIYFTFLLTVWQDVMLQVLDLKNYSQFVVEYLTRLLGRHAAGPALNVKQYLTALDAIYRPNVPVPNQVTDALHRQAQVLRVNFEVLLILEYGEFHLQLC